MSQDETDDEKAFALFDRFLEDWSRRDFIRRMGATAAWTAFSGGALAFLEAKPPRRAATSSRATSQTSAP